MTTMLNRPRAKVIGLTTGVVRVIAAQTTGGSEETVTEIGACGLHRVHEAPYMRVEYDGSDLIVCTLHGAKVAVP